MAVGNALREVAGLADGGEEAEGPPRRREDVGIDVGHTRLFIVAPSERLQALQAGIVRQRECDKFLVVVVGAHLSGYGLASGQDARLEPCPREVAVPHLAAAPP